MKIKIFYDADAFNPRENCDHLGKMYCRHRRYVLGDEDAEDPMALYRYISLRNEKGAEYLLYVEDCYDGEQSVLPAGVPESQTVEYVKGLIDDVINDLIRLSNDAYRSAQDEGRDPEECPLYISFGADIDRLSDMEDMLDTDVLVDRGPGPEVAVCLPIYLYDHSGITVSHGSFYCPWDSGQVGWHYATWEGLAENWPDDPSSTETLQKAEECLKAELAEYDAYLRGDVYTFVVEDDEGNYLDSCGGFINDKKDEDMIRQMMECAGHGEEMLPLWKTAMDYVQ